MTTTFPAPSRFLFALFFSFACTFGYSQNTSNHGNKFEQLGHRLPTPNSYRNSDGSPGPEYWQQRADYKIKCSLNTKEQRLDGEETITYHNLSPNTLRYLWLQLDENQHAVDADNQFFNPSSIQNNMSEQALRRLEPWRELDKFGCKIEKVSNAHGQDMNYTINKTMMRINLESPLAPGEKVTFHVKWHYYLIDRMNSVSWGRGGFEYFPEDGNYLYTITQWFPRLCVYNDVEGWQNNQFTGRGEFALEFGDYDVSITVPQDHLVGATGVCSNYEEVLSPTQLQRWQQAQNAKEPLKIVTLEEAKQLEKTPHSSNTKTWHFNAKSVRDFAWTASRKFIWDAMPHITEEGKKVMCMSYYAKEAYPIYERYSTKAVAHTLNIYSQYSIPYPYPTAISVEAANGMEYPMICFNPGRAEKDG
ncbi:MAG TPA: M1 family peptidase, partial [Phaeodactylibacter sp.]|nr:M1 family peptidase [Phaeodactylibacter sp.]